MRPDQVPVVEDGHDQQLPADILLGIHTCTGTAGTGLVALRRVGSRRVGGGPGLVEQRAEALQGQLPPGGFLLHQPDDGAPAGAQPAAHQVARHLRLTSCRISILPLSIHALMTTGIWLFPQKLSTGAAAGSEGPQRVRGWAHTSREGPGQGLSWMP
jgi:hypothetical protein